MTDYNTVTTALVGRLQITERITKALVGRLQYRKSNEDRGWVITIQKVKKDLDG